MSQRRASRVVVRVLLEVSVLVLAVIRTQASPAEAEWPGWRGRNRDGKSPDKGLLKEWPKEGPRLLWKVDTVGKGFSSVAVAGGRLYTTGDREGKLRIFAFDLDGKPIWDVEHERAWTGDPGGSRSTPVIDGGDLYIISAHGLAGAYDAKTGKRRWTQKLTDLGGEVPGWGYAASVLIHGNLAVVTPGRKNCIAALDKKSGKTAWTSKGFEGGAQYSSPIAIEFEKRPLIIDGTHGGIVCVSAKDGRVQWSNDFSTGNTANCPTPAYSEGYVFWSTGYGKGGICLKLSAAADGVKADVAWKTDELECHHGGYIIHEGFIYGNHDGGWSCLELKTGKRRWYGKGVGKGSLCYADGMLYLFGEDGGKAGLAVASPEAFQMKGEFRVDGEGPSWAHPTVIGGRLYLRYDKNLYCFDVKKR